MKLKRPRLATVALSVVIVLLSTALALLASSYNDADHARSRARDVDAAVAAAQTVAASATTFSSTTADSSFEWISQYGTKSFADTYAKSAATLKKALKGTTSAGVGKVIDAAGTAPDSDHVTVLVDIEQTLTIGGKAVNPSVMYMKLSMLKVDGRWLVNGLAVS